MLPVHAIEDLLDFLPGEDGRQAFGSSSADGLDGEVQSQIQDVFVEEANGIEGLVLGRGGDLFVDGKVGQEGFDLRLAHIARVSFPVEEYEASDPTQIGFFSFEGVVFATHNLLDAIEK